MYRYSIENGDVTMDAAKDNRNSLFARPWTIFSQCFTKESKLELCGLWGEWRIAFTPIL
jgi:hypothetical protein